MANNTIHQDKIAQLRKKLKMKKVFKGNHNYPTTVYVIEHLGGEWPTFKEVEIVEVEVTGNDFLVETDPPISIPKMSINAVIGKTDSGCSIPMYPYRFNGTKMYYSFNKDMAYAQFRQILNELSFEEMSIENKNKIMAQYPYSSFCVNIIQDERCSLEDAKKLVETYPQYDLAKFAFVLRQDLSVSESINFSYSHPINEKVSLFDLKMLKKDFQCPSWSVIKQYYLDTWILN